MADDPFRYFRVEARELLDQLSAGVLDLEAGTAGAGTVPRLLRAAHTLKGAARVVRRPEIADRTHTLEEVLGPYRDDGQPTHDEIGALLGLIDAINGHLAALDASPSVPAQPVAVDKPRGGADPADLQELLEAIGETNAHLAPLRRGLATLERAGYNAQWLSEHAAAPAFLAADGGRAGSTRDRQARLRIHALADELTAALTGLGRALGRAVEQTARELQQVRACAERLRLVPAGSIFTPLHRAVRDVADTQGKRVTFEGRGAEVRLDPTVLAEVHAALLHIVRNAVAHGIEPAEDRVRRGKPPEGHVVVEVTHRAGRATFSCADDGRGFDLGKVRAAADRLGLAGTAARDQQELMALALHSGLSTAGTVDEVSGRGVGLDVARDVAERFGGEVTLDSEPGRGATVRLTVPLTLVALDGLICGGAAGPVAIPLDAVRHTVRLRDTDGGATRLVFEEQTLPLLQLDDLVPPRTRPAHRDARPRAGVALVVDDAGGRVAVRVDDLRGIETMVVRALPPMAPATAVVGGVAHDADGNPRIVLAPEGIVAAARHGVRRSAPPPPPPRHPVLVIDDSLTSRTLEQSILESAGYEVEVAASAEEGLEKARARPHALFMVDVEMPGMDGFTFVATTRADPQLRDTPAVLVSSRASADDRRRGREAGAALHMDKNAFDQGELLRHIARLVR
jgi:two-component system, chemotaxis family, sensor kinase CheA